MAYVECRDHDLLIAIYEQIIKSIKKESGALESKSKRIDGKVSQRLVEDKEYAKLNKQKEEITRNIWLLMKKKERLEFFIRYMKHLDEQVSIMRKNAELYTELQHQLIMQEMMAFLLSNDPDVKKAIATVFYQLKEQNNVLLIAADGYIRRLELMELKNPQLKEQLLSAARLHKEVVEKQMKTTVKLHEYLEKHGNNIININEEGSFKTEGLMTNANGIPLYEELITFNRVRAMVLEQSGQLQAIINDYAPANTDVFEERLIKNQTVEKFTKSSSKLIESYDSLIAALDELESPKPPASGPDTTLDVKPILKENRTYSESKAKPVLLPNPKPKMPKLHELAKQTDKHKQSPKDSYKEPPQPGF